MKVSITSDQLFKAFAQCYGVLPRDYENVKQSFMSMENVPVLSVNHVSEFTKFFRDCKFLNIVDTGRSLKTYLLDSYLVQKGKSLYEESAEVALEELAGLLHQFMGKDIDLIKTIREIITDAPEWLKLRYENHNIYIARAYAPIWLLYRQVSYHGLSTRTDTLEEAEAKFVIMCSLRDSGYDMTPEECAYAIIDGRRGYTSWRTNNLWVQALAYVGEWRKTNVDVNM